MTDTIERVGVVGCGLMGSGIAEVCARAGLDVMVREVNEEVAEAGRARLVKSLDRGLSAGKMTEDERDAAVARLGFTTPKFMERVGTHNTLVTGISTLGLAGVIMLVMNGQNTALSFMLPIFMSSVVSLSSCFETTPDLNASKHIKFVVGKV